MIPIDEIFQEIPAHVRLTEMHYAVWLDRNWKRLGALRGVTDDEQEVHDSAVELFISFQAFHICLKRDGLDRIQLNEDYELWRDVLRRFFDEDQYYGELDYIHDEVHKGKIVRRIVLLNEELEPLVAAAGTEKPRSGWEEIDDFTCRADEAFAAKSTRSS